MNTPEFIKETSMEAKAMFETSAKSVESLIETIRGQREEIAMLQEANMELRKLIGEFKLWAVERVGIIAKEGEPRPMPVEEVRGAKSSSW